MAEGTIDVQLRRSADIARRVLLTMGKWRVPASPANYQLWYEYIIAENEELVNAVQSHAESGSAFTQEVCDKLISDHLGGLGGGDGLDDGSRQATEEILRNVLKEVLLTGDAASQYGESLTEFSQALSSATSISDIQAMVRDLMTNTARMSEQSRQFQERLEEAQQQTEELRQRLETVQAEALTDGLTGLPNRRALELRMKEFMDAGITPCCVGMVDADHFKSFNDTYGHSIGDQVLKMIAASFNEVLEAPAFAARYGGEEFTLILPHTQPADAHSAADAVREAVASKQLKKEKTGEPLRQVTISIGLTQISPTDSIESALERADEALYLAKSNGRNCVCQAMPNTAASSS